MDAGDNDKHQCKGLSTICPSSYGLGMVPAESTYKEIERRVVVGPGLRTWRARSEGRGGSRLAKVESEIEEGPGQQRKGRPTRPTLSLVERHDRR